MCQEGCEYERQSVSPLIGLVIIGVFLSVVWCGIGMLIGWKWH